MNCLNCGKETIPVRGKFKKYCNLYCQRTLEAKNKKVYFDDINCSFCEKKFTPVDSRNKFCSKYCKVKSGIQKRTNKPKTKECLFCKKEFSPYTALDKFCSANCRVDNVKSKRTSRWNPEKVEKRKGVNNPAYVHGMRCKGKRVDNSGQKMFDRNKKEYQENIINEHGFLFCEVCNRSGVKFESHHIVFRSEKPLHTNLHDKENIILVCVPCHNKFHANKGIRNELVLKRNLHLIFGNDILNK